LLEAQNTLPAVKISIVKEIEKIRVDSIYEKKKHFNASGRKEKYHYWLGIPVVVINILLGSFIMGILAVDFPAWAKWITAVAAFASASMSGVSTFLNLRKDVEGHRRVGNRYLELTRECDIVLAKYKDGIIDKQELSEVLDSIKERRAQVNIDAENYSTSEDDYRKAQRGVEAGEEKYEEYEIKQLNS